MTVLVGFSSQLIGIGLGVLAGSFFPGGDYMTPLFIVLAIHIYLEDMFEKERKKKNKP